jgi:hypothetical protein
VEDVASGEADLAKLKKEELPAPLQGLSLEEQKAYLARQRALRDSLNVRLAELSARRTDFLRQEQQRLAGRGDSFDLKVAEIVGAQLERLAR